MHMCLIKRVLFVRKNLVEVNWVPACQGQQELEQTGVDDCLVI